MMAIVVKGDALDEASVKAAFDQIEEVDAVVSTVGGTPADARADSEARALAVPLTQACRQLQGIPEHPKRCRGVFELGIERSLSQ